jgi:uncharacterized membrane protein YccC
MADIDVERKGPAIWPWLIGLLALALLIWALVEMFGGDDEGVLEQDRAASTVAPEPIAPVGVQDAAMPAAVTAFVDQCAGQAGQAETGGQQMGPQHRFTVDCFRRLRDGIDALVEREQVADTDVSARFEQYASTVGELEQSDSTAVTHSNLTRDAANTAVEVLHAIHIAWYQDDAQIQTALDETRQAAEGISPNVPMLEQRESVRTFFREAGEFLRMLAENRRSGAATR